MLHPRSSYYQVSIWEILVNALCIVSNKSEILWAITKQILLSSSPVLKNDTLQKKDLSYFPYITLKWNDPSTHRLAFLFPMDHATKYWTDTLWSQLFVWFPGVSHFTCASVKREFDSLFPSMMILSFKVHRSISWRTIFQHCSLLHG